MISRSVDRMLTQLRIRQAEAAHGRWHPATFAAYGRAFVAWDGRIRPPAPPDELDPTTWAGCCRAYTTAQLRATGSVAWDNHRTRQRNGRLLRRIFPRLHALVK